MSHTLDNHIRTLDSLCRICGKINNSKKNKAIPCENVSDDILFLCRLDLKADKRNKHSRFICETCRSKIRNIKNRQSLNAINRLQDIVKNSDNIWCEYSESDDVASCSVCNHRQALSHGVICYKSVTRKQQDIKSQSLSQDNEPEININTESQNSIETENVDTLLSNPSSLTPCTSSIPIAPSNIQGDATYQHYLPPSNLEQTNEPEINFNTGIQNSLETENMDTALSNPIDYSLTACTSSTPIAQSDIQSGAVFQHFLSPSNLFQSPVTSHVHAHSPNLSLISHGSAFPTHYTDENLGLFPLATQSPSHSNVSDVRFVPSAFTSDTQTNTGGGGVNESRESTGQRVSQYPSGDNGFNCPTQIETIDHCIRKPESEPLTRKEERLFTCLAKRKLFLDSNKQTIKCVTGGQPIVFQRIIVPRKQTTSAKSPTKKKRARLINKVRTNIAGSTTASDIQRVTELKVVSSNRRQEIYKKAGGKNKISIGAEQVIVMNEALGLSYRKGKIHSKLLKKAGVKLEGEKKIKEVVDQIVEDFVVSTSKTFHEEDCSKPLEVPYTKINNIPKFLDKLLDAYKEKKLLTWHGGNIPENEVWVKIGGDHGKNSLKFTLEVANTKNPNSKKNTIVIAFAAVKDTYTNMRIFLESGLGSDIDKLMNHKWKGKSIKLFLNGDYEFLSKIYGISGANGIHFCVYCLATRNKIHSKTDGFQLRTIESLKTDNQMFKNEKGGDKKYVSGYNNCLHTPLLNMELTQACPPYLHILLGIVLKHHKKLEEETRKLEKELLHQKIETATKLGKKLINLGANWKKAKDLEDQINVLRDYAIWADTKKDRKRYKKEFDEVKAKHRNLEYAEFQNIFSGPLVSCLDEVLKKNNITPQQYHSRSFVGNHCHKYLTHDIYGKLTEEIVSQLKLYTNCTTIIDNAYILQMKFDNLNKSFKKVHVAISHTNSIHSDKLDECQTLIDGYMETYRRLFTNSTIPKQHILEHHCIPFIKQHGFSLGLLGEQGTEASHQSMAVLEKRACGIVDPIKKGSFILKTHILNTFPLK